MTDPYINTGKPLAKVLTHYKTFLEDLGILLSTDFGDKILYNQLLELASIQITTEQLNRIKDESYTLYTMVCNKPITRCRYMQDTGQLAFPERPCKGNKVQCQLFPELSLYTSICKPHKCKYYCDQSYKSHRQKEVS